MSNRVYLCSSILVLLSSCNSSSGPGSVVNGPTGTWCDQPYYQKIIGTYTGNIEFQQINDASGGEINNCHWDTSLTISGEPLVNRCFLQLQLRALPTQFYIAESSDPAAGQCREDENRIYRIDDPNDSVSDQELLNDIGFPILLGVVGHELDPTRGPYFGEDSVQAFQIYLFAGGVPIADKIQISELDYLNLIRPRNNTGTSTTFESILVKEEHR